MKSNMRVYSQERSNRILPCVSSSAVSYRLAEARHAFLSCPCSSNLRSLADSVARLCHVDIETRGAHSFRTRSLSKDWKALMRNDKRCIRMAVDKEASRLMDKTRRKNEENCSGSFEKVIHIDRSSLLLTVTNKAVKSTW